jgi:hypothetical protein
MRSETAEKKTTASRRSLLLGPHLALPYLEARNGYGHCQAAEKANPFRVPISRLPTSGPGTHVAAPAEEG